MLGRSTYWTFSQASYERGPTPDVWVIVSLFFFRGSVAGLLSWPRDNVYSHFINFDLDFINALVLISRLPHLRRFFLFQISSLSISLVFSLSLFFFLATFFAYVLTGPAVAMAASIQTSKIPRSQTLFFEVVIAQDLRALGRSPPTIARRCQKEPYRDCRNLLAIRHANPRASNAFLWKFACRQAL